MAAACWPRPHRRRPSCIRHGRRPLAAARWAGRRNKAAGCRRADARWAGRRHAAAGCRWAA
eukprot:1223573-Pyramimonas_sp.AAC.1